MNDWSTVAVVVTCFKARSGFIVEKMRKTKKIPTTTSSTNPPQFTFHCHVSAPNCLLQNATGGKKWIGTNFVERSVEFLTGAILEHCD